MRNENKKTILLLSDDVRSQSGIASISRELVLGTAHKYNWVQVGAAMAHATPGQIHDLSNDVALETGVEDAHFVIYCNNGYGDPDLIRNIILKEKVDGIVHFTDPRYWIWLYQMEWELRQNIPIMYLNIWDDTPDPQYNETYYASCDLLMAISKQTYGINHRVLKRYGKESIITYVPHGINSEKYFPMSDEQKLEKHFLDFKSQMVGNYKPKRILLWVNRNIGRKRASDLILAWKEFEERNTTTKDDYLLLLHTSPIDEAGTDLYTVLKHLAPGCNIKFTDKLLNVQELNYLYNMGDALINISDNEGFGLTTAEGLMAGKPIIVNVTGGLQDQCGFINPESGKFFTPDDYITVQTLADKYKWNRLSHGEWAYPIWPSSRNLKGSIPTPYIFEDNLNIYDVSLMIESVIKNTKDSELQRRGLLGREYLIENDFNSESMCKLFGDSIDICFSNWKKRDTWNIKSIN